MMKQATLLLLGLSCLVCAQATRVAVPEPAWHQRFTVTFTEKTKILYTQRTSGTWYYDYKTGREAIVRDNGKGDRYCGSIHAFTSTPCVHIVVNGTRYLNFPDLHECCQCCTAEDGCGILSPRWLDGAEFLGTEDVNNVTAYKWNKKGLQANYYYATADEKQIPVELDQIPNDFQTFEVASFNTKPIPSAVFAVPDNCNSKCPFYSVCTIAKRV